MTSSAPLVRPFAVGPVYLPTGPEATAFDRWSVEDVGVSQAALMEAAGRSAADVLARLYPNGKVVALVGAGNNGGDALVLIRTLAARGREVELILVADRDGKDPLLHGWTVPTVSDNDLADEGAWKRALAGARIVVDGILGTGIQGAPRPRQAKAIQAVAACGAPVLSLDLPSGVDSVTGTIAGEAVRAEVTVCFGWPKLGALLSPGRENSGRVIAVEIGFPPEPPGDIPQVAITPTWAAAWRPSRAADTHKNAVGALLLLAGRKGMAGAAILAGRAALRAGVGLLRIASVPENRAVLQTAIPEAVFVDVTDTGALADAVSASRALALGPGLGTEHVGGTALATVLAAEARPRVLDADALNLVALGRAPSLEDVGAGAETLVTPHPGEMERLAGTSGDGQLARARLLAANTGVTVLLKGMPSVVVEPHGRALVDTVVTSDLAQAGMGDVLTGVAGAFLAQGLDPQTAGGLALYQVGRAAAITLRGAGMSVDDVLDKLPATLHEAGPGDTDLDLACVRFDLDAPR